MSESLNQEHEYPTDPHCPTSGPTESSQQPNLVNNHMSNNQDDNSSDDEIQYLPQEDAGSVGPHVPMPLMVPGTKSEMDQPATGSITNDITEGLQAVDAQNTDIKFPLDTEMSIDPNLMQKIGLPKHFSNRQDDMDMKHELDMQQEYKHETLPPNYFTGATNFREQQTVRKGQKETFYCEYCMIELNSRDTLISHTKGQKHQKKEQDYQAEVRRKRQRGIYIEDKTVRQIANPLPLQKKVPVRLNEKLRETTTSIVGLDFIHEIIACSNAEVEPYYECGLCGQQGEANAMFQHLQGKPHRVKFLQNKYPNNLKYIDGSLNQGFLEREIDHLRLRENLDLDKIHTEYSDELFPWTAGKAPWSVEQGGTGITPTRARNRIGLICQDTSLKRGFGSAIVDSKDAVLNSNAGIKSFKDLDPSNLEGEIENSYDMKHACCVIQKLSKKLRDYKINKENGDPMQIELAHVQIDALMETLSLTDDGTDSNNTKRIKTSPSSRVRNHIKREPSPRSNTNYDSSSLNRDRDNSSMNDRDFAGNDRGSQYGSRGDYFKPNDRERYRNSSKDYDRRY